MHLEKRSFLVGCGWAQGTQEAGERWAPTREHGELGWWEMFGGQGLGTGGGWGWGTPETGKPRAGQNLRGRAELGGEAGWV